MIFISKYKTAAPKVLTRVLYIVERRYGYQVVFIRTNEKKTLIKAYQEKLALREGITFETSAPYTSEQNGHAERQEGIIVSKARTMRIATNIPPDI